MQKPFRFRYTSEIAGSFVLISAIFLVIGIFVAGKAQGWFEPRFEVVSVFLTREGAYGLQVDSEVKVRNTIAGRVKRIRPNDRGQLEARFEIKDSFRKYVTVDSVARIKKKFGVAGDSYVEIERGKGVPVQDGATIEAVKDEELMEMAQKALKDLQGVVIPMLDQVQQILTNVNGIVGSVNKGEGVAGTVVNDKKLALDLKEAVANLNGLLAESQNTFKEVTVLVKGAQKHWLLRKYVDEARGGGSVSSLHYAGAEVGGEIKRNRQALTAARLANNSEEIFKSAYNLAVCLMLARDYGQARNVLKEARLEAGPAGERAVRLLMLESELARAAGDPEQSREAALAAVALLDRNSPAEIRMESRILLAEVYCDLGRADDAEFQMKEIKSLLKGTESSEIKAYAARANGRILSLRKEFLSAAAEFDKGADLMKRTQSYVAMAFMLEDGGRAYGEGGSQNLAADRFFRAGRTFCSAGQTNRAWKVLAEARTSAKLSGNDGYAGEISALCDLLGDPGTPGGVMEKTR